MKVLLATGLSQIEQQIESNEYNRCYQRSVLLEVAKEYGSQTVVLSPLLQGEEDLLKEIITPLRSEGIRIVFLPGNAKMPDTKEWMKRLLPWGVYDYVFDPVTAEKIIERINNPAQLKNLPQEVILSSQESQAVGNIIPDNPPEPKNRLPEINVFGNISEAIGNVKDSLPRIKPKPTKSKNAIFNQFDTENKISIPKIPEIQLPKITLPNNNLSKDRQEKLGLSDEASPGVGAIIISFVLGIGIICLTIVLARGCFPQILQLGNYIKF